MSLFGSKPIKLETPSSGDGLYTPWPVGLKPREENSSVKMNLECGPNAGHRECR